MKNISETIIEQNKEEYIKAFHEYKAINSKLEAYSDINKNEENSKSYEKRFLMDELLKAEIAMNVYANAVMKRLCNLD
ncbi:hypothetical protein PPOLYM_01673 [Paenibacillus polymyxa]|uniref:hypothetical protein n=1 Tax=Paenibacillus polymyxa TaxID=1406 RepID=UPI0009475DA7|nr:hypothetical protein [Paenibacillus polymyxa]APQ60459.1 hypothetical protein VK72_17870 [Paenibacillus polymyxa]VUG05293.1 hypothetical protein PPOLYM_01673 [Paenibacillus polymyxa]